MLQFFVGASPVRKNFFVTRRSGSQQSWTPWPPRAHGNYALALLILAFAFSFLDRVILSMLMVPIQKDLAFSDIQLALQQKD